MCDFKEKCVDYDGGCDDINNLMKEPGCFINNSLKARTAPGAEVPCSDLLARQLCAAYWRGKFDGYGIEGQTIEGQIKARVDQTWKQWISAAKSTLSMMEC